MERHHQTEFPIIDLLRHRWSPRAFAERPVEAEKIRSILEAARWAPSSSNEQPWNFIVASRDNTHEFERMLSCLVEKNQQWAKSASVLMLAAASTRFERSLKPNRHTYYDLGQAVMCLVVQATSLDLHVHQMAGFSPDKARQLYNIPESADAVTAIAMGYLGEASSLPEDLRARETVPGERKPIKQFVFAGRWGQSARVAAQ
jgi:nitroreductase